MTALIGRSRNSNSARAGRRGCGDPEFGRRVLSKLAHPAYDEPAEVQAEAKFILRCRYRVRLLARYPDPRRMIARGRRNQERMRAFLSRNSRRDA
jgi:hypothetical protein